MSFTMRREPQKSETSWLASSEAHVGVQKHKICSFIENRQSPIKSRDCLV